MTTAAMATTVASGWTYRRADRNCIHEDGRVEQRLAHRTRIARAQAKSAAVCDLQSPYGRYWV